MKHSLQNKIILLILVGILFSSLTIGGLGIYSFRDELENSVISTMNLTCQEKAEQLNNVLGRIEQSTEVLAVLAVNHLDSMDDLQDEAYRSEYLEHLCDAGYDIAYETDGSIGIYLRLNPDIAGPTEGFYWLIGEESGVLELEDNTNITQYSSDDREHVGWYYEPVQEGTAIWMDPYENQNIGRTIVSYTMPIYKDNQLIGIVGMDIDWNYITGMVDEISLYETGYAFLVDENFKVSYCKEFEMGEDIVGLSQEMQEVDKGELVSNDRIFHLTLNGDEKTATFAQLSNGKYMAVLAPTDEINEGSNQLVARIAGIVIVTSIVFVFITIRIAKSIIRPLEELNVAAKDIADGKLDVDIKVTSNDEIGTLAESFSETARQLKIKIDYINNLAYYDKLTGLKNNTAYLHEVATLKGDMSVGEIDFTVFVVDVNGLKFINDNYGHELGNELIIKATQIVSEIFGPEHSYRIGGDEFAVILRDVSPETVEEYMKKFEAAIENQKGKLWASASIGSASFNSKTDSAYEMVFHRADEEMYDKKVRMKAMGKTSKVIED